MRIRKIAAALIMLLLCFSAQNTWAADWKKFTSDEGRFKVLLPIEPVAEISPLESGFGKTMLYSFLSETDNGNVAYLVTYNDYSGEKFSKYDPYDLVVEACDAHIKNNPGKIRSNNKIKLGPYPGKEVIIETDSGTVFYGRSYIVNSRLYQVLFMTTKELEANYAQDIKKFFNSFELLNQK